MVEWDVLQLLGRMVTRGAYDTPECHGFRARTIQVRTLVDNNDQYAMAWEDGGIVRIGGRMAGPPIFGRRFGHCDRA